MKLEEILQLEDGTRKIKLDALCESLDDQIYDYRLAISLTTTVMNNSCVSKELHSNAIAGYKAELDKLLEKKAGVLAARESKGV